MCHDEGIAVTGYYSLIYNNWAHDNHPDWRMIDETGKSVYEQGKVLKAEFANNDIFRYGLCCPNNQDYREFVRKQIKEMAEYFTVDGMFYDMLFWPHMCYCDSCKKRWTEEVGGDIPTVENWKDEAWLLHIEKRRQWMGEFAQMVTDYTKELNGEELPLHGNISYVPCEQYSYIEDDDFIIITAVMRDASLS